MKKLLVLILSVSLCIFPISAKAIQLFPQTDYLAQISDLSVYQGAWSINDIINVYIFKNSKGYTISIYKNTGRNNEENLIENRLDSLTIPIQGEDSYVRGRFDCYRKSIGFPDKQIIVLINQNKPYEAWFVKDNQFHKVDVSNVICDLSSHME